MVCALGIWYSPADRAVLLFFFNDTATTEIYTLSLHDALPICLHRDPGGSGPPQLRQRSGEDRSEEHTSELQSRSDIVCRLLLEKKKNYVYRRSVALEAAQLGKFPRILSST